MGMNHDISPAEPGPVPRAESAPRRVMTGRELDELGVPADVREERCGPEGPWRWLLPEVYLLHPGPPTWHERLQAALLYAGQPPRARETAPRAMLTGLAALCLRGLPGVPEPGAVERIDVLVGPGRWLPWTSGVGVRRVHTLPRPRSVRGLPCAPVPRAVADAVAVLGDAGAVRALLLGSVRCAGCEPDAVVAELTAAGLLSRPQVAQAVDALLARSRSIAEDRLYRMVCDFGLPDPLWNVDLRLPDGSRLGGVDAYWPGQRVALVLDARGAQEDPALWTGLPADGAALTALGVRVFRTTPTRLRTSLSQQAAVVRAALAAGREHRPPGRLIVLPR